MEVTSSGLTHCCADKLGKWLTTHFVRLTAFHLDNYTDREVFVGKNWGLLQMEWESNGDGESCVRCPNNERVCKGEAVFSIHSVDMGGEAIPELETRISTCDRYGL